MSQDRTLSGLTETSLDQCQDFFINAPIGMFTSTPECRYLSANPAMARMLGYESPDDLIRSITKGPGSKQ